MIHLRGRLACTHALCVEGLKFDRNDPFGGASEYVTRRRMHSKPLQRDPVLVIRDEQGKLEEVVAEGCDRHLEQMDDRLGGFRSNRTGTATAPCSVVCNRLT